MAGESTAWIEKKLIFHFQLPVRAEHLPRDWMEKANSITHWQSIQKRRITIIHDWRHDLMSGFGYGVLMLINDRLDRWSVDSTWEVLSTVCIVVW